MRYYLVTNNNLSFHLIKTDKDLSETEINRIMEERLNITEEHREFYVYQMWWPENPIIEI